MNNMGGPTRTTPNFTAESERLLTLLGDAAGGAMLTLDEIAEVDSLLRKLPRLTDQSGEVIERSYFDRATGSAVAAFNAGTKAPALSASFREQMLRRGMEIAAENAANEQRARAIAESKAQVRSDTASGGTGRSGGTGVIGYLGWVAAAASIALAAVMYVNSRPTTVPVVPPVKVLSIAEQATALEGRADTLKLDWAPQGDYATQGVRGKVVWNNAEQKGFIRLANLKENDPKIDQFQLWIFDAVRETYPVDGGLFDITQATFDAKSGEHIIPMKPALLVSKPTLFAMTVEKAGGVVVTDKSRLVVVAPVPDPNAVPPQ